MEALRFLQDLAVVLCTAAAVLLLLRRLGWPPVLGYLAAGLLIGSRLVADPASLKAMAEIGVVFLLFALGVEFNLKRLAAVGAKALVCAGIEAGAMTAVGYAAGLLLGMQPVGALLFGGIISLASTAIVARSLLEAKGKAAPWAELASAVLIAEDILAICLLAFFSSAGHPGVPGVAALFVQLARFAMLVTLILFAGLLLLPRVAAAVERSGMDEVRTLAIIGTCFGVSFLTAKLGFSSALGAFLAGAMMSETAAAARLKSTVEPFKDVFGAVFFVAVGMLIDPSWLLAHWQPAFGLALLVVAARLASNLFAFCAVGEAKVPSLQAALARLPVGEFSFILAQLGDDLGLSAVPLNAVAIFLCLGTTLVSGALFHRSLDRAEDLGRLFPRWFDRLLEEYSSGLRRLSVPLRMRLVLDLVRPSLLQIVANLVGLSGLFAGATALQRNYRFDERLPGAVWTATAFISLPFLLALWRKTQAVTLILLEDLTTRGTDTRPPAETHPRMTRSILLLATLGVAWWFLSISLSLLPAWPYTLAPLALMLLAGLFIWRGMNRLYARIQAALRETLNKGLVQAETSATVVSYLVEAEPSEPVRIASYRVRPQSKASGRSIGELSLRADSGATVIQINRAGEHILSPGPQTRLHDGDEVLLVGDDSQVTAAKKLLD